LHHQIQNWWEVQLLYTPQVSYLLSQTDQPSKSDADASPSPPKIFPENLPLYMPLSLPHHIQTLPALCKICQLEQCLCKPQADDALSDVHRQCHIIQGLWQFKKLDVSGTGNKPNTWLIKLYKQFDKKTKWFAERYQTAWQALHILDPDGSWSICLKELKDVNICGPGRDLKDTSTTNSHYEPSWIWLMQCGMESNDTEAGICEEELNDSMRAEWVKTRACMMWWKEELLLVQEEIWQVLVYHKWKASWWHTHSALRTLDDVTILSGVSGYAYK
jgi:hypothetical protein